MSTCTQKYLAYLLRLWQAHQNGDVIWRASLENSRTGERRGFANLALLVDFLQGQLEEDEQDNRISDTPDEYL